MLFFTIVCDTAGKEKVAKWSSAPASILEGFNEMEGQKTFQNWVKNAILPNRPVFTPHTPSLFFKEQQRKKKEEEKEEEKQKLKQQEEEQQRQKQLEEEKKLREQQAELEKQKLQLEQQNAAKLEQQKAEERPLLSLIDISQPSWPHLNIPKTGRFP